MAFKTDQAIVRTLRSLENEWTADKYCSGHLAETPEGDSCSPSNQRAVKWCAGGYLQKLNPNNTLVIWGCFYVLAKELPTYYSNIHSFSDYEGHTATHLLVQNALQKLEGPVHYE